MRNQDKLCGIKYIDGKQFICMPDGTIIPGQVSTVVTDDLGEMPRAMIEIHVNLENVEIINKK
jgi:hypothetical protein